MGFQSNSQMYNITTENELSVILSHFNTEFIFDIIRDNLSKKFNYNIIQAPNIVNSFEQNFKVIKGYYSQDAAQIDAVRIETYNEIIDIICKEYQLQFNDTGDIDYYSAAFYLYDFLVSNFSNYMVMFFANYIYRERNGIYDAMNLTNMKKNKDSSTLYGKKAYKDIKLAVINANLDSVIDNISGFDIDLPTILSLVYADHNIVNYISTIVSPIMDFFTNYYVSVLQSEIRPMILSNIRIEIQKLSIAE